MQYRADPGGKRKKAGRPKHTDQERTFQKMCHYFVENDEQLTVTDLAEKMQEYFEDADSVPYGKQYLKSKLLETLWRLIIYSCKLWSARYCDIS